MPTITCHDPLALCYFTRFMFVIAENDNIFTSLKIFCSLLSHCQQQYDGCTRAPPALRGELAKNLGSLVVLFLL